MSEDYSAQKPKMEWNAARGVWETTQKSLLCEHLEPFSATWPTSGTMQDGKVYELQTQEHHTSDLESLLLRTPTAQEAGGGLISPSVAKFKNQTLRLGGQIIDLVEPGRLPVVDEKTGKLLPTPNTMDHLPPRSPEKIAESKKRKPGGYANVREVVVNDVKGTKWGKFEPAIRRWEGVTGRKAPAPTKPDGKDGQHRLSAEFTEWMMGLPQGWITDVGLKRNDELKACGNGVVPQQAKLALTELLNGLEW